MKNTLFAINKGIWAVSTVLCCILAVIACNDKEYLDVADPNVLSSKTFPNKVEDLDLMLIDLYGRLRNGYWNSTGFRYFGILPDHTADLGYNGSNFNEFAEMRTLPSDGIVGYVWVSHYDNIARCNNFLQSLEKIRPTAPEAQAGRLNEMEGEARFLRALNYFYLISFFGETMITSEADRGKLGVPLWDKVASELAEASKERATVGEVWDFIITDLTSSAGLLKGKKWDDANKPRVDEWAAKSLLGKCYAYTSQWTQARDVLKDVVDNSGKQLVDYKTFSRMFNGDSEFNSESIFEVNFTPDRKDVWNGTLNTSTQYGIFVSPSYLDNDGNEATNGFGNLFIHDQNLDRFGFTDTTKVNQKRPDYIQKSIALRTTKQVDPRMMVGTLQPWVDSLYIDNKPRPVTKNRGEGFPLANNHAWCHRKYVLINRSVWGENGESIAANMYVLRLADIYLLYAEALTQTGNTAGALEYVNKVHRRAYSQPVNLPSVYDYTSLTAQTAAQGANDHLSNDPLKYERWAELFAEGQWWFDVIRWKIGPKEFTYYQRVKSGDLVWNDRKYAFPIPQNEIFNNAKIRQNPGY